MVRDFSDEPVSRALVEQLMVNATHIPSAGYSQGSAFVVLTDPGQRRLFWETTSGPDWRGESESVPLTRAPVVIIPLAHKQAYLDRYAQPDKSHTPLSGERSWPVPYWDVDTGMASLLILLTATDEGLGSLFFGVPPERHDAVRAAFDVPTSRTIVGVVSIGYAVPGPRSPSLRRHRRSGREVAHWGRFGVAGEDA